MKDVDWDLLRLFGHVAREGSLARAAERAGISAPTLGRQMLALERRLGRDLFERRQTGYELTHDGRALAERLQAMETAATAVSAWSSGATEMPIVTISGGTWMSRFVARNLAALWSPEDRFRLCFKTGEVKLHLERREADIGLRNARPESGNLAGRRSVEIAFAPFCARDFDQANNRNWISLGTDQATTPSARWVFSQPELWVTVWTNTPRMLRDLARGGAGRCVLPCFVGDSDPELVRAGPLIEALTHQSWIVAHDDERRRPEVRTVIDRLAALFAAHRPLFEGARPIVADG